MDFRILCIIVTAVAVSFVDSCTFTWDNVCSFIVTCVNNVDSNLDWTRFSNRHQSLIREESCQPNISYGGYRVYPVTLVFKLTFKDVDNVVPVVMSGSWAANFLNVVQYLDLSDDGYNETPDIKSMPNLVRLNISRNQLTVAMLSNTNELSLLTDLDLSHNTISDIQVNTYHYTYKKLTKLDLSHNYLVKIPDAVFDQFDYLQTLDLSYNYIDTLSQFTFEGVKQLTELNLSYNRLKGLNSSLFRFIELKILNIKGNRIKEIKFTDFEQLRNLETLDLSSNNINTISSNIFTTMGLLQNLYLNSNQIEVLNKNTFSSLTSLKSIDLSKNKFKSLPKGLFKNNTILMFSIQENSLEGALDRGMFDGVNVTELDFSNQFLTAINDYAFYELIRLDTLLLNSNQIQSLSTMCFKTLINLQKLDLSNNHITNINFNKEDFSNLRTLLLKNNYLSEINHEQLQHLNSLEFLDLSNNDIARLEPQSFQSLKNLINLHIDSNPLVGTLQTGTFDGLILLPSLDISQNLLTTIQNASFNAMNQLKELNMSHCQITELQYNTFSHTGYLETLDLSYNKLDKFFVNTSDLVGIGTLFLNNNLIKSITSSSFHGLTRLSTILLSYNAIEDVDEASFTSLVDLRSLDLSYNENLTFTVDILEKNAHLTALKLSGVKTRINFADIKDFLNVDSYPVTTLEMSYCSVQNVSTLNLVKITHLDTLVLSYNNISELHIGDFTGIGTLRILDLSYNHIRYIQPGVFKDNTLMHFLNISHNTLSTIGYGIFRGLIYLSYLDVSYNNIKDLESERFYEVKSLSNLIADNNKIDSLHIEEFVGTSLSKLSIGDNPIPCQVLVKLQKNGVPFEITAIRMDEHNNENVNGVTCNKEDDSERSLHNKLGHHNDTLNGLQNILYNFTNRVMEQKNNEYLNNITYLLAKSNSFNDDKLSNLANLTSEVIAVNNNTNSLIKRIIDVLLHHSDNGTPTIVPSLETIVPTTTHTPLSLNPPNANKTDDIISYIDKIKKELESALIVQKQNMMNEIENKLASGKYHTETMSTNIGQQQLVSNNDDTKSYFTEICVALILLILVGLVLYKFYKSRMFIRNRFSYSTRELPGSMENSAL